MKRCPKCSRTYADDGFTFCLEDGALLSASYHPPEEPISTLQTSRPPATVALPAEESRNTAPDERASVPAPTVASPSAPETKPFVPPQRDLPATPRKRSKLVFILVFVLVIAVLGLVSYYYHPLRPAGNNSGRSEGSPAAGRSQCPRLVMNCWTNGSATNCQLQEENSAWGTLPQGVSNVKWSVSSGRIKKAKPNFLEIDTWGLNGSEITVNATFTTNSGNCPNIASSTFVVTPK